MKKIASVALVLLLLLELCACSHESQSGQSDPTTALVNSIEAYIQNEMTVGESIPPMLQYQNEILSSITYDIQLYNMDTGTMDVEFTYIDALDLADNITDSQIAEDAYYALCIERIHAKECRTVTEVIKVHFEQSEDGYSIIRSDPLTNVLCGGVLNYYLKLLEEANYE